MFILGVIPGLPFLPFAALGGLLAFVGFAIPKRQAKDAPGRGGAKRAREEKARAERRARSRSS